MFELNQRGLWNTYDLYRTGGPEFLIIGAICVACILYAVVRRQPMFLLVVVPLAIFIAFYWPELTGEFRWGRSLLNQYELVQCQVAEGMTRVEAQQRREGHSVDKIVVGGVPLEVSHFEVGPHYHESIVYGGVLKDGVSARVWYCPGAASSIGGARPIVRIDLRR